jgi:hypothetical protein
VVDDQRQQIPFPFANGGENVGRNQTLALAWTHSFERGWINQFRASGNRSALRFAIPDDTTSPSELGFKNVNPDDPAGVAPTIMTVNGYFFVGPNPNGPTKTHDMVYQYQDSITIPFGRSSWKFGADLRFVQDNFDYDFYNNGAFSFGEDAAGAIGGTFTGNALADFIAGFPGNYFQLSNAIYGIRTRSQYYYAEDVVKLTGRITLNIGLRYEYNNPQSDIHNEITGFFGAGAQSTVFPAAPPGILYPGDPGTPSRALVYPDRNNFAPRFGFAWDIFGNAKLVMRGGGGVFYDIEDGALNIQFGGQPPFGGVTNTNFTSAISLPLQISLPTLSRQPGSSIRFRSRLKGEPVNSSCQRFRSPLLPIHVSGLLTRKISTMASSINSIETQRSKPTMLRVSDENSLL